MASPEFPWNYFVSYAYARGFGACEISCARPADNFEEVATFCETIAEKRSLPVREIAILNFILLSGPEQAPHVPARGSDVETWIERKRDQWPVGDHTWAALDLLHEDYCDLADRSEPLDQDVTRGGAR